MPLLTVTEASGRSEWQRNQRGRQALAFGEGLAHNRRKSAG
jgi:hypothetical protein